MSLDKLIEQYERETGKLGFRGEWDHEFVEWLASRPTCGIEQRKFLDEVEKLDEFKYLSYSDDDGEGEVVGLFYKTCREDGLEESVLFDYDFIADLSKVIKGE